MNIVYLIGNGFDLKLKLRTRYDDFYKNAYTTQDSDTELIKQLKATIKDNITDWADLEKRLGEYTITLKDLSEFDEVFDDIRLKLAAYINEQDRTISISQDETTKFIEHISRPVLFLTNREKAEINAFYKTINSSNTFVNIINFNYTQTIAKILNNNNQEIATKNSINRQVTISKVYHIHGFTDSRFALGVDRIEQIDNITFRENEDVVEAIVKPIYNSSGGHLEDEECRNLISSANIICIFGMSLGDTDKTWWEMIGNRLLKSNLKIVLFWWEPESENNLISVKQLTNRRNRKIREIKYKFLKQASLYDDYKDDKALLNNIYIVYNQNEMFDIKFE